MEDKIRVLLTEEEVNKKIKKSVSRSAKIMAASPFI